MTQIISAKRGLKLYYFKMSHYELLSGVNMANDLKRLSKFLAVILRHNPSDFGVELDENGFTEIEPVWQAILAKYGKRFTYDDLEMVVEGDPTGKKRYEIIGDTIRAMYGHSQIRDISYPPAEPPEMLYHGTNSRAVDIIRETGLQAMNRQYVHLTTSLKNATNVAKRRTDIPVLLIIRALEAYQAGYIFHHAENEHYLIKSIPPEFIEFPND